MTAIASLLSTTATMPPTTVAGGIGTPTLASFLDLLAPAADTIVSAERQSDAGDGKPLPPRDDAEDDALAWLGIAPLAAMVPAQPAAMPGLRSGGISRDAFVADPLPPLVPAIAPVADLDAPASLRSDGGFVAGAKFGFDPISPIVPAVAPAIDPGTSLSPPGGGDVAAGTSAPMSPIVPAIAPIDQTMPGVEGIGSLLHAPAVPLLVAGGAAVDPASLALTPGVGSASPATAGLEKATEVPAASGRSVARGAIAGGPARPDPGSPIVRPLSGVDVATPAAASTTVPAPVTATPNAVTVPDTRHLPRTLPADIAPAVAPLAPDSAAPVGSAPAARVFAEAIHRALGEQDRRSIPDMVPPAPAPTIAVGGVAAAAGLSQQGTLDMRQDQWPQAMIERIVQLRDMAAEHDTRLRLSPDMLGAIDVSLKRDGDAVQVQITAEQASTRQMLADAQPRLTELADARGVKLHLTGGQASGGSGHQAGGDAPRQPAATTNPRPRSADRHDAVDDTDRRIA